MFVPRLQLDMWQSLQDAQPLLRMELLRHFSSPVQLRQLFTDVSVPVDAICAQLDAVLDSMCAHDVQCVSVEQRAAVCNPDLLRLVNCWIVCVFGETTAGYDAAHTPNDASAAVTERFQVAARRAVLSLSATCLKLLSAAFGLLDTVPVLDIAAMFDNATLPALLTLLFTVLAHVSLKAPQLLLPVLQETALPTQLTELARLLVELEAKTKLAGGAMPTQQQAYSTALTTITRESAHPYKASILCCAVVDSEVSLPGVLSKPWLRSPVYGCAERNEHV